ncbi:MAG: TIGR00341 family protein [Acidimicrobiia bacterium]|nr:TIGR00341 family protein [Acidimicrobiia bacterium]
MIVPPDLVSPVLDRLVSNPGVVHLVVSEDRSVRPDGRVVTCEVAREVLNDLVEHLQDEGLHHTGAILVERIDTVISDTAAEAESEVPGHGSDALVWEELEETVREEGELTPSFMVFMAVASMIAAIGILSDSAVLVIAAMVIGPDFGPVAGIAVSIVKRRSEVLRRSSATLLSGFLVGVVASLLCVVVLRLTGTAPSRYEISERVLTAFVAHPDTLAAVVAVLAGIVGMLSMTQDRHGALVGVLVAVTTIPAVGNVGLGAAYLQWGQVRGSLLQLAVNVVGLVAAGALTLVVQSLFTTRLGTRKRTSPTRASRG